MRRWSARFAPMARINEHYAKLPAGYLFPEIGRRVRAYQAAHPDANIIRLGIGDVTEPLVPAGTIAALATTCPSMELSVDTVGNDSPVGHAVRYPKVECGITVMFNEYACAVEGTLQPLVGSGRTRVDPPAR